MVAYKGPGTMSAAERQYPEAPPDARGTFPNLGAFLTSVPAANDEGDEVPATPCRIM